MPTLIQVEKLHKQYGADVIFDDASAAIGSEHKIGIIGRNGAGKSTLCRIIMGEEEADSGRVVFHDDLRLSYLEQKDPFQAGETVLAFLMRYSEQEDWRCGMIAGQFLLDNDLLARPVAGLSGGFQTRVKLAAMLLRDPNFLILDEPTNYLDLKTLILLENFLTGYDGGFLIVSHDREFLKKTCRQTMEIGGGRITLYPGAIEAYLGYKETRREQAEHYNAGIAIRRKELETFIAKNKAKASKATQAASKSKMLERLSTIAIEHPTGEVTISMPKVEERKGTAFRCDALAIGYPGKTVASNIDIEIERGSHVAVLGDNGQGKTTFLRTIAGSLPAISGTMRWGHEIRVGYYAQHVFTTMDPKTTVLAYLEKAARSGPGYLTTQQVLDMAGSFLFRGDDVRKRIEVLSGGERSRLCLAGLLLARYPVLLLDEPTNHLDFETVEALASALGGYDGTLFFTSHDRTFVSMVASHIIDVRDGAVKLYPDDYGAYVYRIEKEVRDEQAPGKPSKGERRGDTGRKEKDPSAGKRLAQIKQVEKQVATLESEKQQLIQRMADEPGTDTAARGRRLAEVMKELEREESRWMKLQEEHDAGGKAHPV
ncbi:MAG: ABC-F family ATP-binding cassette domain-containing protein [Planctomycetes bacterium]|nr:ABC-F family ATP-binding cassette domain-containing protein [Planctomycetota bacterium]